MEVITQDEKQVIVKGDVAMRGNRILFNDVLLGEYKTPERLCEVFAELTCRSWNEVPGAYKMPAE